MFFEGLKYHQNIIKKIKILQTVSKITNQVQRSKRNKSKLATRYNGTKCPENKLPKKYKHTLAGCLKIVRVCDLLVAIISVTGKVTPQLELYTRATLLHCQFCATRLFEDFRVC